MRQILQNWLCLAILFMGACCAKAQCPQGEWGQLLFTSQAEVDNFIIEYPNCTQLTDRIIIGKQVWEGTSDISDLTPFQNLTSVKDVIIVNNEPLTSLNGLHNLVSIEGILNIFWNNNLNSIEALNNILSVQSLNIDNNDNLINLNGLQNISQVTENVVISQNDLLTSLEGLTSLINVGETFEVWTNSNLISLEGIENLTQVSGWRVVINDNQNLQSLNGLNDLTQIPNGNLEIFNNPNLTDLQALSNLTSLKELKIYNNSLLQTLSGLNNIESMTNLTLTNNPNLQICSTPSICDYLDNNGTATISGNSIGCGSIAEVQLFCEGFSECPTGNVVLETQSDVDLFLLQYPNCTLIQGNLLIGVETGNSTISDLDGLQNIENISGKLSISNTSLTNLSGLNSLTQIGGDLTLKNNASLQNLSALTSLISINASAIIIENNDALTSLAGLDNINPESIVNLILQSSANLSTCDVNSICTYISSFGSTYTISGNAAGCNSFEEVLDACQDTLPQCPSGEEFILASQEELEHFLVQYPSCTEITGLLRIRGVNSNITDLSPLNNITKVGGLVIFSTNLISLDGLENLTTIEGIFDINGNNYLLNLNGLSNLSNVNGILFLLNNNVLNNIESLSNINTLWGLTISLNPSLNNLTGLHNLTSVKWPGQPSNGDVSIRLNPSLTSFEGLNNLAEIDGSMDVVENSSLNSFDGLNNLLILNGDLRIQDNSALTSISALENITDVQGIYGVSYIYVMGNPSLESLQGLHNITRTAELNIFDNDSLINLNGLESLEKVGSAEWMIGDVYITNNDRLENLSGLENLNYVYGRLAITGSDLLKNINSLSNLEYVRNLSITGNPVLENLTGIENVEMPLTVESLFLEQNNILTSCNIPSICNYLSAGGLNIITSNSTGCNSAQEILDLCELSIEEISDLEEISFYPVPTKQILNIASKSASQIEFVKIFDLSGKEVFTSKGNNTRLDISVLPAGTYVVSVKTTKGVHNEKIIKK